MAGKYDLKKSPSGKFMFNLKSGNGQIVLTIQLYDSRAAAEKGIASVRKNSPEDGRYERKVATSGETYFVLKSGNSQVIGKSQMYKSKAAMENGIASVKKNGAEAGVVDNTA